MLESLLRTSKSFVRNVHIIAKKVATKIVKLILIFRKVTKWGQEKKVAAGNYENNFLWEKQAAARVWGDLK